MSDIENGTQTIDGQATDADTPATGGQDVQPDQPGDSAPQAAPNGGRFVTRVWKMKGTGNEIPVRYDKAEIRIRLAAQVPGSTDADAKQAMLNMLALTGGNVQAVVDQFNATAALDVQKALKAKIAADSAAEPAVLTSVADLQAAADEHVIAPNQRGGGTGGKKAVNAAKAAKLDAVQDAAATANAEITALWQTDPTAAQIQTALMIRLKLLTEEQAAEISGGQYTA